MNNLIQVINSLKSNPAAFLGRMGVSIPQGMTDPNAILNQIAQSGRFSQAQINQAYQQARQILSSGAQGGSFVNNKPKGYQNNVF